MTITIHLELSRLRLSDSDLSTAVHWFMSELARDNAELLNSFGGDK